MQENGDWVKMDVSKPLYGLWGYESYNRIELIGFIKFDQRVCPNSIPPPDPIVVVIPDPVIII